MSKTILKTKKARKKNIMFCSIGNIFLRVFEDLAVERPKPVLLGNDFALPG